MNNNSFISTFSQFPVLKRVAHILLLGFLTWACLAIVLFLTLDKVQFQNNIPKKSSLPKIYLIGCSNMDYNYNDSLLNAQFKNKYQIIKIHTSLSAGMFCLLENIRDQSINKDDILIYSIPLHIFIQENFAPFYNADFDISMNHNRINRLLKQYPFHSLSGYRNYHTIISNLIKLNSNNPITHTNDNISTSKNESYYKFHPSYLTNARINITYYDSNYVNFVLNEFNKIPGKHYFRFEPLIKNNFNIPVGITQYLATHTTYINKQNIFKINHSHNSPYHLNNAGSIENTNQLIQEMKISVLNSVQVHKN